MIINIDETTNEVIDQPSDSGWELARSEKVGIFYTYVVDKEAVTDIQFVRGYPNGGKDYREIVVSPEEGHYDITYSNGGMFPYPIDIPDDMSKEYPTPDVVDLWYWHRLTEREIVEQEAEEKKAEENDISQQVDDLTLMMADILGGAVK